MTNIEQINPPQVPVLAEDDKYYQILIVTDRPGKTEPKHINVEIVTQTKKEFQQPEYSINVLEGDEQKVKRIGDYIPTYGLVFPEDLLKEIFSEQSEIPINAVSKVNDFYSTTRSLYITRKISQLLAKSWYAYLKAIEGDRAVWEKFVLGQWKDIEPTILDGLIIREILLFDEQYPPDHYLYDQEKFVDIYKLHSKTVILPTSRAWQGISLSLLLGGQVYYEVESGGAKSSHDRSSTKFYRRVSEPILSTFETVNRYTLEVDFAKFSGDIQELQISPQRTSSLYKAIIPYPPIPSERNLDIADIQKWAEAKDDVVDDPHDDITLPFYDKNEDGSYNLNVKYVSPPFPYLPLSTT